MLHQAMNALVGAVVALLTAVTPARYAELVIGKVPRARPLVVSFWATWCDTCGEEMPDLIATLRGRDIDLALVSLDVKKDADKATRFLAVNKAPGAHFIIGPDVDAEAFINQVDRTWDGTIPYTLLYDRDGKIVARLVGRKSRDEFRRAFDQLK